MQSPLSKYMVIAKRWYWVVLLGVIICGSLSYVAIKARHPDYQASANLILNDCTPQTTPYDCTTAGIEALPTYAQLVTSPIVLNSVVAQNQGLTTSQLAAMVTVKPQSNTLLIEIDVTNKDPQLAMDLANEISQSFAQYANISLPGKVQVIPAQLPLTPTGIKPSLAGGIGALVGLGLALALIVIFEWIDDHPGSVEEVQEILGKDVLTVVPRLSHRVLSRDVEETPALVETSRILAANLNAAQTMEPFKLTMVTSVLAGEGKSTMAANMAIFLARGGKRVLLVDANLRNPVLHKRFQIDNFDGLSTVFSRMMAGVKFGLQGEETEIPTLRVLTAGMTADNFADFLQSPLAYRLFEDFQKTDFDYVIIDAPPLLPVADAQILASYVQMIVLVTDVSKTSRKQLTQAKKMLRRTRATVLGVALNKSDWPVSADVRQYQDKAQSMQHGFTALAPYSQQPSTDEPVKIIPETPRTKTGGWDDTAEPTITVKTYRLQQDKDE